MDTIISFDLKADFGFLKKPDTNDPMYLTFNMLHRPALLGILGAIIGLGGFSEAKEEEEKQKPEKGKKQKAFLPEYYQKLQDLKVGIRPLGAENGNFSKTIIKYNNAVGYANEGADKKSGATLNIIEQTLIKPSYRCYLLLEEGNELHQKIKDNLKNSEAEYLPYLGKNDFSVWWDNFQVYATKPYDVMQKGFKMHSIFIRKSPIKDGLDEFDDMQILLGEEGNTFVYFENLPTSYHPDLMQYSYNAFTFTDWNIKQGHPIHNLYELSTHEIIQVF